MGPGVSCFIPQPLVSFLPTIHHYLSNFSQFHKPDVEWRGDNKVYYRIFGGLMKTFVCTTHLASAIHIRRCMSLLFPMYHVFCLQSLIPVIEGTHRIYICITRTLNGYHTTFNSAGRSLKSCSELFSRIPTALYFFRESL